MSEELRPCPFCKGEFAFDFEAKNFRCGICGATVPPDPYGRTVNTRPIEDELTARIAELEAERRWIPVGEKPLEAGTFFVLLKNGEVTKDFTFIDGGRYYWWNHGGNVTHWMPLPEPPIVYGKVCEE